MAEDNEKVMELRRWFRQTKAHNTMVLGKTADHEETGTENINKAAGTLLLFEEKDEYQLIVTENQGYSNFKHRRSIFYVKQPQDFFVLVDGGFGTATGYAKLYFHLCDGKSVDNVLLDKEEFGAHTTFDDSNNLLIRTFGEASRNLIFKEFGGRISYQTDRKYEHRKSYAVVMRKPDNNPVRYITVLYPVDSATGPVIKGQFVNTGNEDKVSVNVTINKKLYNLSYSLNKRR